MRDLRWFLFTLLLTLGLAQGALAHAVLVAATPEAGATLDAPPAAITLEFNEPVTPRLLQLVAPDGTTVTLDATTDGNRLEIAPPAGLAPGSYVLSWRVVSDDGHPLGDSLFFSVETASAPIATAPEGRGLPVLIWVLRLALYWGLFVGVGGVFVTRWLGGRTDTADLVARWAIAGGIVAALVSLGAQGADLLGQGLAGVLRPATWVEGASGPWGRTVALALLALVSARLALGGVQARLLALAGLLLAALALVASGHVATATPHWLTRGAIFLHALMVAFWVGALAPLALALRSRTADATAFLLHFSRVIPWALIVLVGAGITMARIQIGGPQGLLASDYGHVFIAKMALVGLLLLAAAWNRWRLTAPVLAGDAAAIRRFRRAVRGELLIVLLIFAVVALWRFTPPPRALAAVPVATAPAEAD